MNMEMEIQRFKMALLRKAPFYGDIVVHIQFIENKQIPTAATNGKVIWYNPRFFETLTEGERNFVFMHEIFHILLRHGIRNENSQRDHDIWNTACDFIVNNMLSRMTYGFGSYKDFIPLSRPKDGLFASINANETAENLYGMIVEDNKHQGKKLTDSIIKRKLLVRTSYTNSISAPKMKEVELPADIIAGDSEILGVESLSDEEKRHFDMQIGQLIRASAEKNRNDMNSIYVPKQFYSLIESKRLDWKKLLKNFLSEVIGDDSSYTTPERKYLHMDMILPGHSLTEETIDEVWAFVDSSGSVGHDEMSQFLTQLYRISREFKCTMNICYWDTSVTDVYTKISSEKDILNCLPKHSGGTNINCVYDWIKENKVKPDVMLILTDGYFGTLTSPAFSKKLSRKTILVLSTDILINDNIKMIGKIAKL